MKIDYGTLHLPTAERYPCQTWGEESRPRGKQIGKIDQRRGGDRAVLSFLSVSARMLQLIKGTPGKLRAWLME